MNEPLDSLPEPGDDPSFEELIARLKSVEPPLEARIANRMAVAHELSALAGETRLRRLPWWRRSISIPVPLAAALVGLAALVLPSGFRGWQGRPAVPVDSPNQPVAGGAGVRGEITTAAKPDPAARRVSTYYETETYLCGVGRVSSESVYLNKE